jgi:hypothetical protein
VYSSSQWFLKLDLLLPPLLLLLQTQGVQRIVLAHTKRLEGEAMAGFWIGAGTAAQALWRYTEENNLWTGSWGHSPQRRC